MARVNEERSWTEFEFRFPVSLGTKVHAFKTNIEVQFRFSMSQENATVKTEMTIAIVLYEVMEKPKTKIQFNVVGKRKTKLKV